MSRRPRPSLPWCAATPAAIVLRVVLVALLLASAGTSVVVADRPSAMRLMPRETLVFVRVANARELVDRFQQTSTWEMFQDPEITPLLSKVYGSLEQLYTDNAEENVGLSLDELQRIPQGEVAFALVARKAMTPTFALLLDMGEDGEAAIKMFDRVQQIMLDEGADVTEESVEDVTLSVYSFGPDEWESFVFVERENTLVITGDLALAKQVLANWEGVEGDYDLFSDAPADDEGDEELEEWEIPLWSKTLAENEKFVSILRTCRSAGDEPPQLIFFVDPIETFRNFSRGNTGMTVALAMLPGLGLDGLLGVGGSMSFATGQYDDIVHAHLLLDNPRTGVLSLLNLRNGETDPAEWVPDDIETYMSWNWDVQLTYEKLIALVDYFQGEGKFEAEVQANINENAGFDLHQDFIDQATGRFQWLLAFPKPARVTGRIQLFAYQVKDPEAMQETFAGIARQFDEQFDEGSFGSVDYWVFVPRFFRDLPEEERPFSACLAVLDDYAVVCTSVRYLEQAIEARDGTRDRLIDAEDYQDAAERIFRTSTESAGVLFNRPAEGLRFIYELIDQAEARDFLDRMADEEEEEFFAGLRDALEENPLPPFEVLEGYLRSGGGVVRDDETGLHYQQFTFRK